MTLYRFHVQKISGFFEGCEFKHVHRNENEAADILSKLGSSRDPIPPDIALEHLRKLSMKPSPKSELIFIPKQPTSEAVPMDVDVEYIGENPGTDWQYPKTGHWIYEEAMSVDVMDVDEQIFPVRQVPGWAQPIMSYMMDGSLPSDPTEARRVQRRSKAYTNINMELYKRSVTMVLQRCVEP